MRIGIIGAGNVGTAIAADLARKNEVILFSSKPECINKKLVYRDSENQYSYESNLAGITSDYKEVVRDVDILFIVLPTFLIKNAIEKIVPYIDKKTLVGFVPGAGGVEFLSKKLIDNNVTIFGFERVPYVSRLVEYGKIVSASKKSKYRIATFPKDNGKEISTLISKLFNRECNYMNEFISMTLTPTLHISRLYDLYKDYTLGEELDENPFFYGEWTDNASIICFKLDNELHEISSELQKRGIHTSELVPYSIHYESETPELLTKKLRTIPSLSDIKGPLIKKDNNKFILDIESRYFTESYPYRLAIVKGLADLLNKEVPMTDIVLKWYSKLSGKRYYVGNRFIGKDIIECNIPQNYGINNIEKLVEFYK